MSEVTTSLKKESGLNKKGTAQMTRWSKAFRPSAKLRKNKVIKMKFVNFSIQGEEDTKSEMGCHYQRDFSTSASGTYCSNEGTLHVTFDRTSMERSNSGDLSKCCLSTTTGITSPALGNLPASDVPTAASSEMVSPSEQMMAKLAESSQQNEKFDLFQSSMPSETCTSAAVSANDNMESLTSKLKSALKERDDALTAIAGFALQLSEAQGKIQKMDNSLVQCRMDLKAGLSRVADLHSTLNENKLQMQSLRHEVELAQLSKRATEWELQHERKLAQSLRQQLEAGSLHLCEPLRSLSYSTANNATANAGAGAGAGAGTSDSQTLAPREGSTLPPPIFPMMKVSVMNTPETSKVQIATTATTTSNSNNFPNQDCSIVVSPPRPVSLFASVLPSVGAASNPTKCQMELEKENEIVVHSNVNNSAVAAAAAAAAHAAAASGLSGVSKVAKEVPQVPLPCGFSKPASMPSASSPKTANGGNFNCGGGFGERPSKLQKLEYAAELEEQIRVAKEKRMLERQRTYGQHTDYFPFGKPGGGAPLRGKQGVQLTNLGHLRSIL